MSSNSGLPTLGATTASNSASASNTASASSGNTRSSNSASNTASSTGSVTRSASGSSSNFPSTGQTTATSISSLNNAPSLTGSGGGLTLTGSYPTLAGAFSYPPASVPPTSNAPYMKTSQLPQNFVFIIVGGVLAFILLIVMIWRFLTAWSINRAFKKDSAALYTPLPDIKKRPTKQESGMDMADLSGAKLPKSFNSVPSLFFSPTAEAARQSMIRPQSQHMPSGHYRDVSK